MKKRRGIKEEKEERKTEEKKKEKRRKLICSPVTNDYISLYVTKEESLLRIVYHCLITSTPGTTSVA